MNFLGEFAALSFLATQIASASTLLFFASYQVFWMVAYRRRRGADLLPRSRFRAEERPRVTIQLPVRNEGEIFGRCLRSAASVDYPDDRLQIQILDDSDDGNTTEIIRRTIEDLRLEHPLLDIQYLHRDHRENFKSGALRAGFEQASGDFCAIFDADFVIPKDFLHRTIDYFKEPEVAVVQGRWSYLNRNESVFTRLQAAKLDTHQMFDQSARYRHGQMVVFHGTAGVWRSSALREAGGWNCETEVEDVEMSIHTFLKGNRAVYLDHLRVASELPESMRGFLTQQMRWKRGWVRLALRLSRRIAKGSAPLPMRVDFLQRIHVCWGPMLALWMTLGVLPTILVAQSLGLAPYVIGLYLSMLAVSIVTRVLESRTLAEDPQHQPADQLPLLLRLVPLNFILGLGTSWALTQAIVEGFGTGQFWEVTPKGKAKGFRGGSRIPLAIGGTAVVGGLSAGLCAIAFLWGHPLMAAFYAMLAIGSAWVVGALATNR